MRHLPNAISIVRACCALPIALLVAPASAVALVLFALAALTDALDGALARRLRATSAAGVFLDPLADKVLVLGTLVGLLAHGAAASLPVAAILLRELAITGLRAVAAGRGVSVASNALGKAKAALQGAAVGAQLVALGWPALGIGAAAEAVLWAAAALTLLSGIEVAQRAALAIAGPGAVRAHAR